MKIKINLLVVILIGFLIFGCTSYNEINDELIVAARDGDIKKASALIKAGANVNACGSWEGCDTAIREAAIAGQLDMVILLVAHGAELNKRIPTPLFSAADFGRIKVVKYLLSHGATLGDDKQRVENIRRNLQERGDKEIYQLLFSSESGENHERSKPIK